MNSLTEEELGEIKLQLSVMKQLVGLMVPYVARQAEKHDRDFSQKARENGAHIARLMQALQASLAQVDYPASDFDVLRERRCLACGFEYEIGIKRDAGDYHKGPDIWYACPQCNSGEYVKQEPQLLTRGE